MLGLLILMGTVALAQESAGNDNPQVIRISTERCGRELQIITDAYRKTHPKVQFRIFNHEYKTQDFLRGRIDLIACSGPLLSHLHPTTEKPKFKKAFPESLEEIVFAYRPMALMVHPRNPLDRFSYEQFRLLTDHKDKTWKDLGREKDGPIKFCSWHWHYLVQDLVTERPKVADPFEQSKLPRVQLGSYRPADRLRETWDKPIPYLSKEEDGLGLFTPDRSFAASGLKILPVVPRDGTNKPVMYDDVAAVASGRYWLRATLRMTIHPMAKPAAQQFFKWIQMPAAAEAIVETHLASSDADYPFAPASLEVEGQRRVRQDAPPETKEPKPLPPRVDKIDGAVAVLPFASVSRYFLMADDSHRVFYEDKLFEVIEKDGRLTMVDRTQLKKTIEEQKLSLLRTESLSKRPIIAAGVFVVPRLVTKENKAYFRIEAIHGASATSLGILEVPVDPADPMKFNPSLEKRIQAWWPWVLDTLRRVRTKPRWYVHDVTCEELDQVVTSDELLRHLRHQLQWDRRIAPANGPAMTLTQQERLLHLMGMSENRAGSFVPKYDYAVEGRLQPDGTLQMILRDAWFKRLAEKQFTQTDPTERLTAVQTWIKDQIASHPGRILTDDASSELLKRWIHLQSRLEFNYACDLKDVYCGFESDSKTYHFENGKTGFNLVLILADRHADRHRAIYQSCMKAVRKLDPDAKTPPEARIPSVDKLLDRKNTKTCYAVPGKKILSKELARELVDHWLQKAADSAAKYHRSAELCKKLKAEGRKVEGLYSHRIANRKELNLVANRYWRHAQRVVQLDPMWEQGALPLLGGEDIGGSWYGRSITFTGDAVLDARCFFLSRFPNSKHYETVLYDLSRNASTMGKLYPKYSPFSPKQTAAKYSRMTIEAGMEFCRKYVLPNKIQSGYMPGESRYLHYRDLLYRIRLYFSKAGATPEHEEWAISLWKSQLGNDTAKGVPHSDFIRLAAAAEREDLKGFFKILRNLQQRWPDPGTLPWKHFNNDKENPSTYRVNCDLVIEMLQVFSYKMQAKYDRQFRDWAEGKIATKDLPWSDPDFQPVKGGHDDK